jgi:hypothetical protein
MLRFTKGILLALIACLAAGAFAQTPAKDALKAIADYQQKAMADARAAGKQLDFNTLNAGVTALAEEKIKDIDPATVDAKDAYDWALVFSRAQRHKDVCTLAGRFLGTQPDADQKFAAQILMLNSCSELGEGDMVLMTLASVTPTSAATARQLASLTTGRYADAIAKAKGADEAIKAINRVEGGMVYEDVNVIATRLMESAKSRDRSNPPKEFKVEDYVAAAKSQNDNLRFMFANKRAELLADAGRKDEAVKDLDTFIRSLDEKSPVVRRAKGMRTQMTIIGSPAPELKVERGYGEFKSLADLKGKVVLLDYFAHW